MIKLSRFITAKSMLLYPTPKVQSPAYMPSLIPTPCINDSIPHIMLFSYYTMNELYFLTKNISDNVRQVCEVWKAHGSTKGPCLRNYPSQSRSPPNTVCGNARVI